MFLTVKCHKVSYTPCETVAYCHCAGKMIEELKGVDVLKINKHVKKGKLDLKEEGKNKQRVLNPD